MALREFRSLKVRELRAEKADDGKQYLSGYSANYNVLSDDLGWGLRAAHDQEPVTEIVGRHDVARHLGCVVVVAAEGRITGRTPRLGPEADDEDDDQQAEQQIDEQRLR